MRALPLVLAAVLAGGCAWTEPDERERAADVHDAVRATVAAYNAKDVPRYLGGWTDGGFERTFGVGKDEADEVPPSLNGLHSFEESEARLGTFSRTRVTDDVAETMVTLTELHVVRRLRLSLVREDGDWLLDAAADVDVPPTPGVVEVELREYAIRVGSTAPAGATFSVRNAGREPHQMLLLYLRPSGREDSLGRIERIAPGATRTLVTSGLPAGRYALVCNLPAADGTPHASKGMRALFAVDH